MPVDPFGDSWTATKPTDYPGYEPWNPWQVLISQGIEAARDVARLHEAGYPPGSTIVYAPQSSQPVVTPAPSPAPSPAPLPAPLPPVTAPQPKEGITLSTNTLLILGLVLAAFTFGRRR